MSLSVSLTTTLACRAEEAWREVRTTRLFRHVAAPVVCFYPIAPRALPEAWEEKRYLVGMRLFGILPLGSQWIDIKVARNETTPNGERYELRDAGHSRLVRRWDHRIRIEAIDQGHARYTDELAIEAGVLTPIVWAFAKLFFRHRQRRWRALAARGFVYG